MIKPKIIAIVGPTASGKTKLAIKLAKKFNGEIISADSRQIYKEMDIATAKDKTFPHHLIDIVKPDTPFSVVEFKNLALKKIEEVLRRKKLPILVGGTGLYLDAVIYNYQFPQAKANPILRRQLQQKSVEELEMLLEKYDPEAAAVARKNKRRLIRALEVISQTNQAFSVQKKQGLKIFDVLILGIKLPKKIAFQKINKRVEEWLAQGLIEEVKKLVTKYGALAYALQNTIGYRELLPYFAHKISLKKAKEEIKKNQRRYFRRQMTWFKKNKQIHWIKNDSEAEQLIKSFLNQ